MKLLLQLRAAALFAALAGVSAAAGDEFPQFKQGMWAYSSSTLAQGSGIPRVRTVHRCTSPSDDIRNKWQALATQSCKFSTLTHSGNKYSYQASCQQNGVSLRMTTVISVDNDSAYRVDTESHAKGSVQKEVLLARRVGECAQQNVASR